MLPADCTARIEQLNTVTFTGRQTRWVSRNQPTQLKLNAPALNPCHRKLPSAARALRLPRVFPLGPGSTTSSAIFTWITGKVWQFTQTATTHRTLKKTAERSDQPNSAGAKEKRNRALTVADLSSDFTFRITTLLLHTSSTNTPNTYMVVPKRNLRNPSQLIRHRRYSGRIGDKALGLQ